jgi:ferrous iron transport protein A
MTLADMRNGQSGTISAIHGGHGVSDRLAALGILPGKRIVKISGMILRGPVTVAVDRTQVAIGFGMARKVAVETDPT